jgi:hypothetical protein
MVVDMPGGRESPPYAVRRQSTGCSGSYAQKVPVRTALRRWRPSEGCTASTREIALDFYDQKLRAGSYLPTHARHMETWHRG